MSVITIPIGTKLFHGTGEEFDINSTRPGGYDKIFWTTDSSIIAQSYIPVSGATTVSTTEWLMKPSSSYAEQFGIIYSDLEKTPNGDVRSYRMQNKKLQTISEEYNKLSRASMDADNNKYDVIKAYEKFSLDNMENQDDPDVREKRKELRYDAKIAVDKSENALKELRDYNVNQRKNDYINEQLYKLGYEPREFDNYSHNHSWELKLDRNTILPADYRMKGRLLIVTPKRDMKIFDISTGESDLTELQYHKLDLFDKLIENGYDGIKIDDFAQTEHYGNVGHVSIGFFKTAMKDLQIKEIKDVVHPKDINKRESDEYSKYKEMFESFLYNLKTSHNSTFIESVKQGYNIIFEGVNDLQFVFNTEDIIADIKRKFSTGQPNFRSSIEIRDIGFQYNCPNKYKGFDLNIRWMYGVDQLSSYSPTTNYIIIPFETDKYDKSIKTIVGIIMDKSDDLIHELRHWHDHIEFDIENRKYTRLSQIQNNDLKEISTLSQSVNNLTYDQYINQSTEINAHIVEFIHVVIDDVLAYNQQFTFDDLMKKFTKTVDISGLTSDMKKRLHKRLYVFCNALNNISNISTSDNFRKELIRNILSNNNDNSKIESIEYTHTDIKNKTNIVIFEANYKLDDNYRKWFDKKYIKNGKCIVSRLQKSINNIHNDINS